MKLLLIDDEEFTRKELSGYLEDEGYSVITASNGEDGIKIFDTEFPELVLTDVKMPKYDGFAVLKHIKTKKPETRVIILTGHGDEEMAIKALKNGANDYIKKPINLNHLNDSIDKAVGSIRSLKRTTFNAVNIDVHHQVLEIRNNLEEIYGVTNYITNLNHIFFTKASCEKIKLAIIESLRNSIEHGNLEIGYDEKHDLLESGLFNQEMKNRINSDEFKNRMVRIEYTLSKDGIKYIIKDEGKGFDWKNLPNADTPENIFKRNGRGLLLIKLMMDEVSYNEKGNEITLMKKSDIDMDNIDRYEKDVWICQYIQNKHDLR